MAKNNYSKVEEVLAEGLRKMKVKELLDITEQIKTGEEGSVVPGTALAAKTDESSLEHQMFKALKLEIKHFTKKNIDPFEKLKVNKEKVKSIIDHPEKLSADDKVFIQKFKEQLLELKKRLEAIEESSSDDEIVEKEMKSQKTKRFNINKNWIPLR